MKYGEFLQAIINIIGLENAKRIADVIERYDRNHWYLQLDLMRINNVGEPIELEPYNGKEYVFRWKQSCGLVNDIMIAFYEIPYRKYICLAELAPKWNDYR